MRDVKATYCYNSIGSLVLAHCSAVLLRQAVDLGADPACTQHLEDKAESVR